MSNRTGIGTRVLLTSRRGEETITQMREVTAQTAFRGQSDLSPHFGLGPAAEVLLLEVRWPSGKVSTLANIAADQILEVEEPKGRAD
jgi:hypothetical protein